MVISDFTNATVTQRIVSELYHDNVAEQTWNQTQLITVWQRLCDRALSGLLLKMRYR